MNAFLFHRKSYKAKFGIQIVYKNMVNASHHQHIHIGEASLTVPAAVITYVTVVMVCGILGNGVVLLVYGCKVQKPSNYRSFVLMLAIVDIAQSCIGMPGILVDILNYATFYSNIGCKLLRLLSHVIISASLMTHLLIGIERYRKICKPLKRQITPRAAKMILLTIVLSAFVIGLPAYVFYGRRQIELQNTNNTLNVCFITEDYKASPLPTIYEVSMVVLLNLTMILLFLMYAQIVRKIWKTKRAIRPFLQRVSNVVNTDKRGSNMLKSVKDSYFKFKKTMCLKAGTSLHCRSRLESSKAGTSSNHAGLMEEPNVPGRSKNKRIEHLDDKTEGTETGIQVITGQRPSLRMMLSQTDAETDISDVFNTRISDQNGSMTSSQRSTQLNHSMIKTASSKPEGKRHSRKVTAVSFAITLYSLSATSLTLRF